MMERYTGWESTMMEWMDVREVVTWTGNKGKFSRLFIRASAYYGTDRVAKDGKRGLTGLGMK